MSRHAKVENGAHVHMYDVDSPNGPTSEGTCRVCGAVKTFWNSAEKDRDARKRHWNNGKVWPEAGPKKAEEV